MLRACRLFSFGEINWLAFRAYSEQESPQSTKLIHLFFHLCTSGILLNFNGYISSMNSAEIKAYRSIYWAYIASYSRNYGIIIIEA